ncbi:MAG: F-box protein [Chlamydiales bacterium]|nr:F-box protein [Chlamydiales bacterium]
MHPIQNSSILPAIEKINNRDFFSQQPQEIIIGIFSYLSAIELTKCREVSRKWRRLGSDSTIWNALDLRKISPLLKVFDESDWVTHLDLPSFNLDVVDAPPLDKFQAIPILKRSLYSLPIEGNAGITLLTIPKGLTFNKLVKLAGLPKVGNRPEFRYIWHSISSEIGDIEVDKTYRIVITNNVFKESRNLSVKAHKALLSKIGCEMPKIVEATVLLVVTFMSSGERLYSDNPCTYTRCSEQIDGYQLVVGGFSLDGIDVNFDYFDDVNSGVGGVLRKL